MYFNMLVVEYGSVSRFVLESSRGCVVSIEDTQEGQRVVVSWRSYEEGMNDMREEKISFSLHTLPHGAYVRGLVESVETPDGLRIPVNEEWGVFLERKASIDPVVWRVGNGIVKRENPAKFPKLIADALKRREALEIQIAEYVKKSGAVVPPMC